MITREQANAACCLLVEYCVQEGYAEVNVWDTGGASFLKGEYIVERLKRQCEANEKLKVTLRGLLAAVGDQ